MWRHAELVETYSIRFSEGSARWWKVLSTGCSGRRGAVQSVLTPVSDLLASLLDLLSGVLAITVNAQNSSGGTVPSAYASTNFESGRYDVAALHLEILGLAGLLNLSLGRGSVGENRARRG